MSNDLLLTTFFNCNTQVIFWLTVSVPSVLWHFGRASGRASACKQFEWWGVGVVICLQRGADCLHMVQRMPLLSKTPSSLASLKSRLDLPLWYGLTQVVLATRPLNGSSSSSSSKRFLVLVVLLCRKFQTRRVLKKIYGHFLHLTLGIVLPNVFSAWRLYLAFASMCTVS